MPEEHQDKDDDGEKMRRFEELVAKVPRRDISYVSTKSSFPSRTASCYAMQR